jgi:UDP-N-acetylglucosamine acyltransferase
MAIHPTAIVSPKAELDPSVEVGPYAIIDDDVRVNAGTRIGPHAYLTGRTEIGKNNTIHIGAVIGHEPQDLKYDRKTPTFLKIGDRNVIREYCTVHRGTEPDTATVIGDDCFLMASSHVAHNCILGNCVILANAALLGGHVHVGDRAFISGGAVIHQFIHVGRLAMISGNSRVSMDVPPFVLLVERNVVAGLNMVGLKRAGVSPESIQEIKQLYRLFYRSNLNVSQALRRSEEAGQYERPESREWMEFIRQSPNGICPGQER